MSNFIITNKSSKIDHTAIKNVFSNMHLDKTLHFQNEKHDIIYFYSDSIEPVLHKEADDICIVTGTFFYKNKGFKDSLMSFYKDFISNTIDKEQMFGHFAILIIHKNQLYIFNDALGIYRIFSSKNKAIISTSFLATWYAHSKPIAVNYNALLEKINTGFIVYPDTLIDGVEDITYENLKIDGFNKIHFSLKDYMKPNDKSAEFQVTEINKYFDKIYSLTKNKKISLGVSGGYDSRLLLSIIKNYKNKYLFTHLTKGVHEKESNIASLLTKEIKSNINIIETEHTKKLSLSESHQLLKELIFYYDGRTAKNSGSYSKSGTYNYNYAHLQGVFLGLNGKGGEVYRNYYNLKRGNYTFSKWYNELVCYPSLTVILSKEEQQIFFNRIEKKIKDRVSPTKKQWNNWDIQRYYSEVQQADCEGSIFTAHNKITHYISPFLDANFLRIAYLSFKNIKHSDQFQSNLIRLFSEKLANIKSKYGYSFTSKTLKQKIKEYVVQLVPLKVKTYRKLRLFKKSIQKNKNRDEMMLWATKYLKSQYPNINWKMTINHYAQKNVVLNLASLLKMAEDDNKLLHKN